MAISSFLLPPKLRKRFYDYIIIYAPLTNGKAIKVFLIDIELHLF